MIYISEVQTRVVYHAVMRSADVPEDSDQQLKDAMESVEHGRMDTGDTKFAGEVSSFAHPWRSGSVGAWRFTDDGQFVAATRTGEKVE